MSTPFLRVSLVVLGLFSILPGCGSSSGTTGSTTAAAGTVTVSGSVTSTSGSASTNLSALVKAQTIGETGSVNETVTLTNCETGEEVGSTTTDSSGAYTMEIETDDLDAGTYALEGETSGMSTIVEISEAGDTTINADPDSTIAFVSLRQRCRDILGAECTFATMAARGGFSAISWGMDPHGYFELQRHQWQVCGGSADASDSDVGAYYRQMRDTMFGLMDSSDSDPRERLEAFLAGDLDDSVVEEGLAHYAAVTGTDVSGYDLDTARETEDAMDSTFASSFAGAAGTSASGSALVKGVLDSTEDSLMGEMLDDEDLMNSTVEVLCNYSDATEVAEDFGGEDDIGAFHETMRGYRSGEGDYTFGAVFNPEAMAGMWEVLESYENFDPTYFTEIFEALPDAASVGDDFDWRSCGAGIMDTFLDDPTIEVGEEFVGFWIANTGQGYEYDSTIDPASQYDNRGDTNYAACADPTSSACTQEVFGGMDYFSEPIAGGTEPPEASVAGTYRVDGAEGTCPAVGATITMTAVGSTISGTFSSGQGMSLTAAGVVTGSVLLNGASCSGSFYLTPHLVLNSCGPCTGMQLTKTN